MNFSFRTPEELSKVREGGMNRNVVEDFLNLVKEIIEN
jgi:hypothetical protein